MRKSWAATGAMGAIAALAGLGGAPAPASAQQADNESDEIIVTAQKREESVRDIPFTINVLSEADLIQNRVQSITDVARLTPGFEVGSGFGRQTTTLSVRGVAPQTFNGPTVVVFVDGFTTGLRTDVSGEVFDLERIEILKGPQATLYGRNAIGGTVNYITAQPSEHWEGRVEAGYGSFDAYTLRAGVSGPLSDSLSFRLSGSLIGRDGYFDNAFDGAQNVDAQSDSSARLALRLAPEGSSFESTLALSYTKSDDDCGDCIQRVNGYDPLNPTALPSLDVNDLDGQFNQNDLGFLDRETSAAVWSNGFDFGTVRLDSITGYARSTPFVALDLNRAPGDIVFFGTSFGLGISDVDDEVFSQEVRLTSQSDGPFQWLLGVYYYNLEETNRSSSEINTVMTPTGELLRTTENYAAFLNATYDLNDDVQLGFGVRYDVETNDQLDRFSSEFLSVESKEWLPRASIRWEISPDLMTYATVSRGYHSGGLNPSSAFFGAAPSPTYEPEYVWNYEAGIRGDASNFSYELAAFYIDWQNQQVTSTIAPGNPFTYVRNVGVTTIYGVEGHVQYNPTDNVTLEASAGWNHARYDDFLDQSGVPVFYGFSEQRAGNRPILAPDFSAALSAEYEQTLSADWNLIWRASGRYTGKHSLDNSAVLVNDGYALFDGSITLDNGATEFSIYGTNLFDETYATYAQLFVGFDPLIRAGTPRTIGAVVRHRF